MDKPDSKDKTNIISLAKIKKRKQEEKRMMDHILKSIAKERKRKLPADLLLCRKFPGFDKLSRCSFAIMLMLSLIHKPAGKSIDERMQRVWTSFRRLMLIYREMGMGHHWQIEREK